MVGDFFQRPIEHLMSRLVELWQISQPLHLRHLAILRDTTISGKMAHYIHYTYPTFKSMVDAGEASWEAVVTIKADKGKEEGAIGAIDAVPDLDEYGFLRLDVNKFHGLNNDASLVEIVAAAGIPPFKTTYRDPRVFKLKDGTYGMRIRACLLSNGPLTALTDIHHVRPRTPHKNKIQSIMAPLSDHDLPAFHSPSKYRNDGNTTGYQYHHSQASQRKHQSDKKNKKPLGRPRKFPRTTPPDELSAEQVKEVKRSRYRGRQEKKSKTNNKGDQPFGESQYQFSSYLPSIAAHSFLTSTAAANFPEVRKKRIYRSRKISSAIGYYPSMLAHTLLIFGEKEESQLPARKTIGSVMPTEPNSNMVYLPSKPMHSNLNSNANLPQIEKATEHQDSTLIEVQSLFLLDLAQGVYNTGSPVRDRSVSSPNKRKADIQTVLPNQPPMKRRGRPAKVRRIELTSFEYLPSTIAHTQPIVASVEDFTPTNEPPATIRASRARKQSAKAVESQNVRQIEAVVDMGRLERSRRYLTYSEQLKRIKRPRSGIFIGAPADLKILYRPGRPRKSQVAVFKLPALEHLDWFRAQSSTHSQQPIEPVIEANQAASDGLADTTAYGPVSLVPNTLSNEHFDCECNPPGNLSPPRMLAKSAEIIYTSPYSSDHVNVSLQTPAISTVAKRKRAPSLEPQRQPTRSSYSPPITKRQKIVFDSAPQRMGEATQATQSVSTDLSRIHAQKKTYAAATADGTMYEFATMASGTSPNSRSLGQKEPTTVAQDLIVRESVDQGSDTVMVTQNEQLLEQASESGSMSTHDAMEVAATIHQNPSEINHEYRQDLAFTPGLAERGKFSQRSTTSANGPTAPAQLRESSISGGAGDLTTNSSSQSTALGLDSTDVLASVSGMLPGDALQALSVWPGLKGAFDRTENTWNGAHQDMDMSSTRRSDSIETTATIEIANNLPDSEISHDNRKHGSLNGSVKITKVTISSGSVAVLRRKIIMEIIGKCGGIFPGNKEIYYPFYAAWASRTKSGKPDQRTVEAALNSLVDSSKLRVLRFTFNNRGDTAVTKSILTLPAISPTDLRIRDMQQKIIENDPRWYVPDVPGIFKKPVYAQVSEKKDAEKAHALRSSQIGSEELRVTRQYNRGGKNKAFSRQRKEREEKQEKQLEEELGDADFSIEGYTHNRARMPSETAGLAAFRTCPDGIWEMAKQLVPRSSVRRLDRLNTRTPYGDMPRHPNARRIYRNRLILKTASRTRTSHYPGRPTSTSRLQFGENLGLYSNFERTSSPDYDVTDSEADYRLDPSGLGDELYWLPESGQIYTRRTRRKDVRRKDVWHTLTAQLRDIAIQYRELWPEWMNRRISSKPIHHSMPSIVRDVITASQQYQALMDPRQLFHISTGTYAAEFIVTEGQKYVRRSKLRGQESCSSLPMDLDDLLSKPYDIRFVGPWDRFGTEKDILWGQIDHIKRWELGTPELASTDFQAWRFINLQLPSPLIAEHNAIWDQFLTDEAWGRGDRSEELFRNHPVAVATPISPAAKRKAPGPITKPRRLLTLQHKLPFSQREQTEEEPVYNNRPIFKRIRLRGPQLGQVMGPDGDRRILLAVVVVRTLTGGLEQNIDWVLLSHIFAHHQYSERLIHQRYAYLANRYRLMTDKLQADFQEIFAQAYEEGTVPPLNYDNLEQYDWNGLIDWTMENINAPRASGLPELPSTREKLDSIFDLREVVEKDSAEFYEIDGGATVPKRRTLMHRDSYAVPLPTAPVVKDVMDHHGIAKSWVRANVITPEENYLPKLAREKFEAIGEDNVENAVRDLLLLKVIMLENRGRLVPGRNYDISDYFVSRLRKNLQAENFRQAAKYKASLDEKFSTKGSSEFSWHASNGDVVAVLNLAAHRRIKMSPKNPPMNAFGLLDNGYRSRNVDRSRLIIEVELQPTASYITGNPLLPIPAPPGPVPYISNPQSTEATRSPSFSKIPAWRDIYDNLVPVMWDLALSAILSIMAVRPGVKASDIEKCVRPSLEVWEIESVMQWCVEAGVGTWAKGDDGKDPGGGIKLAEWWWLALGESVGDAKVGS